MDVLDAPVLEQDRGDEQAMVGRLLDERHDRREVLGGRGQVGQPRVVQAHRDLRGEVLELVAGQPQLREHDEVGAIGAGGRQELVVAGQVLVELPERRGDLGERDAQLVHAGSIRRGTVAGARPDTLATTPVAQGDAAPRRC